MMTEDHPNARWLADLYQGVVRIQNDPALGPDMREATLLAHQRSAFAARVSPDFVIHTGGVRLAAAGRGDFVQAYGARRTAIAKNSFRLIEIDQIIADDHYGIVRVLTGARHNDRPVEFLGMGGWRFENGLAVQHWEMVPGDLWDDVFLVADPDFAGDPRDFWLAK
ncbi:nuclear transport factor 2 family protein [Sphingomonas sp. MG17]|jgi:hypothetical protein|uniref:Nuclear transport factor 2 family protein n=1 Tax=Sphingomonas tagetis TaxID=2949092 RepID=A0A9X2HUE3_9SPHN|nr:nuclear transport factor 2 family protein [Sphingomonas tagetis]MCP3732815.1 nuclear transport factor 2 family protein [Sphingomonas tagetis]